MKKTLVSTLIAVPLLALSALASAEEAGSLETLQSQEPMLLTVAQMDDVTAGTRKISSRNWSLGLTQINISPVIIIQIAMFNSGGDITQIASVISGNFFTLRR
jgi:hypothetical protein